MRIGQCVAIVLACSVLLFSACASETEIMPPNSLIYPAASQLPSGRTDPKENFASRLIPQFSLFSLGTSMGFDYFPRELLGMGVPDHPGHLIGWQVAASFLYDLTPKWFIGLEVVEAKVGGKGPFSDGSFADQGVVDGRAVGNLVLTFIGGGPVIGRRFDFPNGFFVNVDLAVGPAWVTHRFRGVATGTVNGYHFMSPANASGADIELWLQSKVEPGWKPDLGDKDFAVSVPFSCATSGCAVPVAFTFRF